MTPAYEVPAGRANRQIARTDTLVYGRHTLSPSTSPVMRGPRVTGDLINRPYTVEGGRG